MRLFVHTETRLDTEYGLENFRDLLIQNEDENIQIYFITFYITSKQAKHF